MAIMPVVALAVLLLMLPPVPEADAAPAKLDSAKLCQEMLGRQTAEPDVVKDFLRALVFWEASRDTERRPDLLFPKLHFTTRSDFSILPNCNEDHVSASLRPWIPYPVGLVVSILATVELDGQNLAVVETEYGLRLLIPDTNLQQLAPDVTYFFPNDARGVEFCVGEPSCSAPSHMFATHHQYAVVPALVANPCHSHSAMIFREGELEQENAYVKACFSDEQTNGAVKVISSYFANEIFKRNFHGIYHRFPENIFTQMFPGTRNFRSCGEEISVSTSATAETGLSGKLPIYFLEWEGSLSAKYMIERSKKLSGQTFSYYSGYLFGSRGSQARLYIIEVIAKCDDFNAYPEEPYIIAIENESEFLVRTNELSNAFESVDGKRSYQETAQTFLMAGQFWVISDIVQYFVFRTILYDIFKQPGVVDQFIRNLNDPLERWRVTNFITHLIMAATVRFSPALPDAASHIDLFRIYQPADPTPLS